MVLHPAFGCLLSGEVSSKGFYVHGLSMGQGTTLNDLLVINLYRSDDPSVLQLTETLCSQCGNSTLKTSSFKRTLLMIIVKSFTFGK